MSASHRLLVSAVVNSGLENASPYQSSVSPSMGRLRRGEVVNENSTVTTTGATRYSSTIATKMRAAHRLSAPEPASPARSVAGAARWPITAATPSAAGG